MKKKNDNLKIVIIILGVIVVILLGIVIFCFGELFEERRELKDFYQENYYNVDKDVNDNVQNDVNETIENNDTTDDKQTEKPSSDDNDSTKKYITRDNALDIALNNAKVKKSDVYDISVELDYKYNQTVYEIDFNYQNYEYEYYINAQSGKILHSFKELDH